MVSRPVAVSLRRLGLMTLVALGVATVGCTKSAESTSGGRTTVARVQSVVFPELIERLPANPRVIVHAPSVAGMIGDWKSRVARSVTEANARQRVEELLEETPFGRVLSRVTGEVAVGMYGEDANPDFVGFVPSDHPDRLDSAFAACLDDPAGKPVTIEGRNLFANRFGGVAIFHGAVPGGWAFGSSRPLMQHVASAKTSDVPARVKEAWDAVALQPPRLFVSAHLDGMFKTPDDQRQAEMLGLDRLDRVTIAMFEDGERCQDTVFLHSASPHKGVFGFMAGKALSPAAVAGVPTTADSVSALSLNLATFWKDLREALPVQFRSQVDMAEQGLGFDIGRDLLAHVGTHLTASRFAPREGSAPVTMVELALNDRAALRATLDKLLPKLPIPVQFESGPDDVEFLQVPASGGVQVGVAFTDDALLICETRAGLDAYLAGAVAKTAPTGVQGLFEKYRGRAAVLSWIASTALTGTKEAEQMLGMAMKQASSKMPIGSFYQTFPWLSMTPCMGDVAFAVVPEEAGLRLVVETDSGLLPFGAVVAAAEMFGRQTAHARQSIDPIARQVTAAQTSYRQQYGRFASSLWELQRASLVDRELARGVDGHLLFRVVSENDEWRLDARHEATAHRFTVQADGTVVTHQ